jgi:uncharacterized membrane-anchored protein YitT (DUF2179 family)
MIIYYPGVKETLIKMLKSPLTWFDIAFIIVLVILLVMDIPGGNLISTILLCVAIGSMTSALYFGFKAARTRLRIQWLENEIRQRASEIIDQPTIPEGGE